MTHRSFTGQAKRTHLTTNVKALLLNHANGPQPVQRSTLISARALVRRGLVRFEQRHPPRETIVTVRGRELLIKLLAREADRRVDAQAAE